MGTRADFYVGRGAEADWIGSIACDGYPSGIDQRIFSVSSPEEFRSAVARFFSGRKDVTLPEDGWPWPWMTSSTTDYSYAFDGDRVFGSCFGSHWFDPLNEPDEHEDGGAVFPDMTERKQRDKFGAHSGVIVVSAKGIEG